MTFIDSELEKGISVSDSSHCTCSQSIGHQDVMAVYVKGSHMKKQPCCCVIYSNNFVTKKLYLVYVFICLIIMWSSIQIVRVLLEAGCHVNVMDSHGWAALAYSAFLGNEHVAMTLLQGGADINAQDMHGRTALQEAIYSGYHHLARLLIDAGCKLDVQVSKY